MVDDIHDYHKDNGADNAVDRTLVQYTPLGIQPSVWIQMYQDERKHLLRACREAIQAGVAERTVAIAQDQARTLALILKMFLMNAEMHWTPEQRIKAPGLIRELINSVPNQPALMDIPVASWEGESPVVVETRAITDQPTPRRKK
jgi:hypothetical protein